MEIIKYNFPENWIKYDFAKIANALINAKAALETLKSLPYLLDWVQELQKMELKREVAGTSRIEGAEFSENELNEALKETPEQLMTRSQRQACAAMQTYKWLSQLPDDVKVDCELIKGIHRRIVFNADDDHCPAGVIRGVQHNVSFGNPQRRGAAGGEECQKAFDRFSEALNKEYRGHDEIIRAFAAHYHFAAIHPFLDGNGRTARALEALLLRQAGLKNICFIAMSNYYYEEKTSYLNALSLVGDKNHDLTDFLIFAMKGLELQINRVKNVIRRNMKKALILNLARDLFMRKRSERKRVIAERQLAIIDKLLKNETMDLSSLYDNIKDAYGSLKSPRKVFWGDLLWLYFLNITKISQDKSKEKIIIDINLDWSTQITETQYYEKIKTFPKSKSTIILKDSSGAK